MTRAAHNEAPLEGAGFESSANDLWGYFEAFKGTEQYTAIDQALHQVGIMPDDLENIPSELVEEAKELIDRIASADDEQDALEAAQKLDGLLWPDPQAN